ncbi:apidaecins type 22-like [Cherax quadricarinatus]|uniref:apidaecins type 22-like n=1 Tax=Cherax quadricarinatus TaxID=27406 RepID=UPI00387EC69C
MNLLIFVFLAAAVCASDVEKRDAEPGHKYLRPHYTPYRHHAGKREAEPEADPTYHLHYVSAYPYLNKPYRYQRSAEPEAEPTYPRYYVPSYPHLNLYRHVRSAEPEAEPTYPRYYVPSYPHLNLYRHVRSAEPEA